MYAPNPTSFDGWYVFTARLSNNETVNLKTLKPASPWIEGDLWEKPKVLSREYKNFRERKFLGKIVRNNKTSKKLVTRISESLKKRYEEKTGDHISEIHTYFVIERIEKPTPPYSPPERHLIKRILLAHKKFKPTDSLER